jgi:hypothetical protein
MQEYEELPEWTPTLRLKFRDYSRGILYYATHAAALIRGQCPTDDEINTTIDSESLAVFRRVRGDKDGKINRDDVLRIECAFIDRAAQIITDAKLSVKSSQN